MGGKMMKKGGWLIVSLAVVLAGCSGPHRVVDPNWRTPPSSFTVVTTEPFTSNEGDVLDDFGGLEGFRQWFAAYLDSSLSISSPLPHSVRVVEDRSIAMEPMYMGNVLVKEPLLANASRDSLSGVVLIVHPVHFRREMPSCSGGTCIGDKRLYLQVAYSVVSVEDHKILVHGLANGSVSFRFAMTRSDWEKVVQQVSWRLVDGTPLKN